MHTGTHLLAIFKLHADVINHSNLVTYGFRRSLYTLMQKKKKKKSAPCWGVSVFCQLNSCVLVLNVHVCVSVFISLLKCDDNTGYLESVMLGLGCLT